MNTIKKLIIITCLVGVLVGCNTVHGAGQDISAGGHAISRAAN
jgi:predicted small secreted protein